VVLSIRSLSNCFFSDSSCRNKLIFQHNVLLCPSVHHSYDVSNNAIKFIVSYVSNGVSRIELQKLDYTGVSWRYTHRRWRGLAASACIPHYQQRRHTSGTWSAMLN